MPNITWSCRQFDTLSGHELYEILSLRAEVFVVEQDCVYQDPDGLDLQSLHLCGHEGGGLVCYARLTPPASRFPEPSIGRIVTCKARRGTGLGVELVQQAIAACHEHWPGQAITISAQQYLEKFYRGFGFASESEPYMEDGIPHLQMRLD